VQGLGPGVGAQVDELFSQAHDLLFALDAHLARVGAVGLRTLLEGRVTALSVTTDQFVDPGLGEAVGTV